MKITLCLLTYNELIGCKNDVPKIKKISKEFEDIYVVDAGSTDGTVEFLKKNGIRVYEQPVRGLNQACHFALSKCRTDAIVFFHPKGSIPVRDVLKFRALFESGYDFVIGSRIIKGARNDEDSKLLKPRKWFVVFLSLVAAFLFKKKNKMLWDVLHGFRGVTKKGYKRMGIKDEGKVTIDIEMVCRAYKNNIKSIEFPTTETARLAGSTHFKAWPTGVNIFKYLKREMLRRN
jgi:glycosyltransferase involved in cell wall biosynthesis